MTGKEFLHTQNIGMGWELTNFAKAVLISLFCSNSGWLKEEVNFINPQPSCPATYTHQVSSTILGVAVVAA